MTTCLNIKSFDLRRREIRRELFLQRQADRDNTEHRLFNDGKKLDAQLLAEGYILAYPTKWGRARAKKHQKNSVADHPQPAITDLFSSGGA